MCRGSSSELQGREAEQREDDRDNHEPRDDLRLAPSDELEVMMDWSHPENTVAGRLERRHLDDHGERLDDEHAAHDDEEEFLLDEQCHDAERSAKAERSDVAHENVRGVRIPPEEPEA